jgi:hypothetical protein
MNKLCIRKFKISYCHTIVMIVDLVASNNIDMQRIEGYRNVGHRKLKFGERSGLDQDNSTARAVKANGQQSQTTAYFFALILLLVSLLL